MNKFYRFGLAKRKVSLVVQLIDSYTGEPVTKGVYAKIHGFQAVAKQDGFFIFVDLDKDDHELYTGGGFYFEDITHLSGHSVWQKEPPVLKIQMTPNSRYALSPKAAFVTMTGIKNIANQKIFCMPKSSSLSIAELEDSYFSVYSPHKINLEGRLLALAKDKKILKIFTAGTKTGADKYTLEESLGKTHQGTELLTVSMGRADENGNLFLPVWGADGVTETRLYTEDLQFFADATTRSQSPNA